MKRICVLMLLAALFLGCTACGNQQMEKPPSREEEAVIGLFAMDIYLHLTAYGSGADAALEQAHERIRELESRWSVTDERSEIYAANHSGGETVTVSEDTASL